MKIALITTDNREAFRRYDKELPWFGTAPEALIEGFSDLPDTEVHVICCTQQPMESPAKLADNVYYHSVLVPKIGWLRTGYQGCIRATRKLLKEIDPDIVHGQGTERDCALSAVFSGFPNVLTVHGNMRLIAQLNHSRPFTFNWLSAKLEGLTLPRSDGVVCITNYTRKAVAPLARKTWLLPNAVDGDFFKIEHVPSSTPRILCIATIEFRKNQNALIRAMDPLAAESHFELVFYGAENENAYNQEFFGLVKARPWCRYVGFADRTAIKEQLATATGVVLPSLEDNCPMCVLEAMASGVPVAAANVGGVPDLIRHQETGWLFDPLSLDSITGAMRQLLGPDNAAVALRARDEAVKRFHPKIVAPAHLKIYREVLSATAS